MIGFKVLTKNGLKGPFKKSSIIKAITAAQLPLQARLLDLETGKYLSAAELVGEQPDPFEPGTGDLLDDKTIADVRTNDSDLKLDEEAGSAE